MKKLSALFLAVLLLLCGCKPAGDPAPELYFYKVVYNGRTYTTDGNPVMHEGDNTEDGFLFAKQNLLGEIGELQGDFPSGTRFYSMRDTNAKVQILAVMEDNLHYFLANCYDTVTVSGGRSIFGAVGLENNCSRLFRYDKSGTRLVYMPLTVTEITDFSDGYTAGGLTEPAGRSVPLFARAFTGEFIRLTLYENGALVYESCPQYAVALSEEVNTMLWGYIDG